MNPTGAPEPLGDSSRVVRGIFFVLPAGVRERTCGCSPRAPGRFGQNRLGGFLCCQRERFFCVVSAGARERTCGCSPRALGWFEQNRLGGVASVDVCFSFETIFVRPGRRCVAEEFFRCRVEIDLTDPGVGACRGSGVKVSLAQEKTLASVRATDGDSLVRMRQGSLIFSVDVCCGIGRGGAVNGPRHRCAPWIERVSLVSSGIG